MGGSMNDAVKGHYARRSAYHNEINAVIPKTRKFDTSAFREHFGYELPREIADYFGLSIHDHIYGWVQKMAKYTDESIILFSVTGDDGKDLDSLIEQTDMLIEDYPRLEGMICIGWTGYSGSYIIYDSKSSKIYLENCLSYPIANSLTELIDEMRFGYPQNGHDMEKERAFMRSFFERYYKKLWDRSGGRLTWELIPAEISSYEMDCLQGYEYTDFIMPDCIQAFLSVYHHSCDNPV